MTPSRIPRDSTALRALARPPVLLIVLLLLLLVAGHQVTLLPGNLFGTTLQNTLHLPGFAGLAFLLARHFRGLSWRAIILLSLLLALALEGSQFLTGRQASLADLATDLAGAGIGVLICRGGRLTATIALVVLGSVTVLVPARVWLAYDHRDKLFPAFLDAEVGVATPLVTSNSQTDRTTVVIDGQEVPALRVCWSEEKYPGLFFDEVVGDWSRFESLLLTVVVEGPAGMNLTVAVGHVGVPGTSEYRSRLLPPGPHRWLLPLDQLAVDSTGQRVEVSHLIVHSALEHVDQCLAIAELELL